MNYILKSLISIFIFTILCQNAKVLYSQQLVEVVKKEFDVGKEGLRQAMDQISKGDEIYFEGYTNTFRSAIEYYLKAYSYNKNNAELNYKLGVCYVYSQEKNKALSFLERAKELKPTVASDLNYFLALANQYSYNFEKAISIYKVFAAEYNESDKKSRDKKQSFDVNKRINECEAGLKLLANPQRVFIDPLPNSINSKFSDYCPVITSDESMMIFTSRRDNTVGGAIDPADNKYYEDIYVSYSKDKTNWDPAINMKAINTEVHDASTGLSPDGQILYTYKGIPDGTIFESKLIGDTWSKPKKMNNNINTKYHETSVSVSYDLKKLYLVSNRPKDDFGNNTIGGKDIFVCEKNEKGEWGPAKNLGEPINSIYDEDAIFMHPNGVTLYFSSKREGSMGGYDIFYSELDDNGKWGEPINIGYPINTPDDDVFFVAAGNDRYAYYSSVKEGGQGEQDIYRITFLGPEKLMVLGLDEVLIASSNAKLKQEVKQETVEIKKVRLTIMKGTISDALSETPIEASIEIVDNDKNEPVTTLNSNSKTGKYIVSLPSGKNYGLAVRAEGYLFYSENIDIPSSSSYQEITKDIVLSKVGIGSKIVLKNIFFDYGKATLRPTSFPELERLVNLLNSYPSMIIEIGGHTDNHGGLKFNTDLSESRAKSVVDYLIDKGISKLRLSYKGYAYTEPVATNDTEDGRQQNRRVEFKVISIK